MNASGLSKAIIPVCLALAAVLIVMLQFGFIFLLIALLPSVVAFYTNGDKNRATFKIVGACNVAATLPTLAPMLQASLNTRHYDIVSVMQDPKIWLFVYS